MSKPNNNDINLKILKFPLPISTLISILLTFFSLPSSISLPYPPSPPLPLLPIPTSQQLSWQLKEMAFFLHFGPNTFTNSEWGDGKADPSLFYPSNFDPQQWVSVAKSTGFSRLILTAKHHDGFCLWPSDYTDYSVKSSKWRDGFGDVVGDLAKSAKQGGVELGLYLSPWDRHERCYGKTWEYNEYYLGQMSELLTRLISFHLDIMNMKGEWQQVVRGTTVGYKRLMLFPKVESRYLRLVIEQARADPLISYIGVHIDPYSIVNGLSDTNQRSPSNGAKFISKLKDIIFYSTRYSKITLRSQM